MIWPNKKEDAVSKHYDLFCEIYGVEPTCEDCEHFVQASRCGIEDDGFECDGRSEFTSPRMLIQKPA